MEKYFCELNAEELAGKTILLDVDGTIATDGSETVDGRILEKIRELLSRRAEIILVSNNKNVVRGKKIAEICGVPYLETPYKKPSKKITAFLRTEPGKPTVVIGDKFLTDVLFAKRNGFELIKTRRLTSPQDRWFVKLSYLIDDLVYYSVKSLFL